jgi:hypothetical protein
MEESFFVAVIGLVLSLVAGSALVWLTFEYGLDRLMTTERDARADAKRV